MSNCSDKITQGLQNASLNNGTKRSDYLSWDEYFMSVALLAAMRSKDPSTQVGACITNAANRIVGTGYNGMPNGLSDDEMPWGKYSTNELDNKFVYVCHAELNAILNRNNADSTGCTIYTTLFPCNECAKVIIQAGIKKVIYFSDSKAGDVSNTASKFMFDKAGVSYEPFNHTGRVITVNLG